MLKLKTEGPAPCLIAGIQPEIVLAIMIAKEVWALTPHFQRDLVITCCTDSHKHNLESLHNFGMAFDMRTRELVAVQIMEFSQELRECLGNEYDVVVEKTHIHVEFDNR